MMMLSQLARGRDWTSPVEVRHERERCASPTGPGWTARIWWSRRSMEPGWHTFAMDNKERAEEKLGGQEVAGD